MNVNILMTSLNLKDEGRTQTFRRERERKKGKRNDNQLTLDITGSQKSTMFKVLRKNYFKPILLQFSINFMYKIYLQILRSLS